MEQFCGIDWAEDHHDIALVDREGQLLARRRISDDADGLAALPGLLADHGDSAEDPIPVAIETRAGCSPRACAPPDARSTRSTRWPWPGTGTGTRIAGRKSDHGNAVMLAGVLQRPSAPGEPGARRRGHELALAAGGNPAEEPAGEKLRERYSGFEHCRCSVVPAYAACG